jgi:NADH-quinone oxidoreductase subunit L
MAFAGFTLAVVFYGARKADPDEVRRFFSPVYKLFVNKWYFDELYQALFVQPALFISRRVADLDRKVIDRIIDGAAIGVTKLAMLDDLIDRYGVDWAVNAVGRWTYSAGYSLKQVQTGKLRQYVTFIVIGTVVIFVLVSFFRNFGWAAN